MPTYEYVCSECKNQWEEIQKISEPALDTCPKCGKQTAKRQISGGNFILKGGGWYADLYSSTPKSGGGKGEGKEGKSESTTPSTTPAAGASSGSSTPSTTPSSGGSSSGSSGSSGSSDSK
jgi:putative FmdB family regulatory protein